VALTLLMWGQARPVWACRAQALFALRAKATMAFPTSQMKRWAARSRRHRDRGAINIRQHGVDGRGLAVAGDEDGYAVEKRPG
jgi:hypothetical protein